MQFSSRTLSEDNIASITVSTDQYWGELGITLSDPIYHYTEQNLNQQVSLQQSSSLGQRSSCSGRILYWKFTQHWISSYDSGILNGTGLVRSTLSNRYCYITSHACQGSWEDGRRVFFSFIVSSSFLFAPDTATADSGTVRNRCTKVLWFKHTEPASMFRFSKREVHGKYDVYNNNT